jgi:hypothetical protein
MKSVMVSRAEDDETIRVVIAALRTQVQVMHIDEPAVLAPWHDATPRVPSHDEPPRSGWNILLRSRAA